MGLFFLTWALLCKSLKNDGGTQIWELHSSTCQSSTLKESFFFCHCLNSESILSVLEKKEKWYCWTLEFIC
jgi:hypothetical protein